jgi:DnaK suppressor protein
MDQRLLDEFKRLLYLRHRELLKEVVHTEADLQGLSADDVSDWSDHAQKERTKDELVRLDANEREELGEIELALQRVADHSYGMCEHCGAALSTERLRALPTTRFCAECAKRVEATETEDALTDNDVPEEGQVPPDLVNLSDTELEEVIRDQIRADGRVEAEELEVTCKRGVVFLGGALPSVAQHSILLQLVTDVLGFQDAVDRIEVEPLAWQRDERAKLPPKGQREAGDDDQVSDRELYGSDDVIESSEEVLTEPPSLGQPTPEQE